MHQTAILDEEADPTDAQLGGLEDRAVTIRASLDEARRPLIVEFAGSPKSGKSTTIDVITHFFKRMDFKVRAPSEGASKRTPYHLRRDLVAFNSWTLNYAISELLDAYHNIDRSDLVILDRGPFDSLAWLGLLHERGELLGDNYATMRSFALLPLWTEQVARLYLFTCDPAISMERENNAKLTRKGGTAMNPEMLSELKDQYDELTESLEPYPVKALDTTRTKSPLGTAFTVAEDVLSLFEARNEP